ncbi:DUF6012 family protein [Acerihabitans sp. TG2]|uniref:DUF6012 family protein n=1 Tax=Acerihabitans sp. TG2 TaxID=3096008 RepID=UPI002B23C124|nr:DUF6012 family protein [Acerihabitans sp. TG2]MEA9392151.1 DUF6012 family protein [Acerihabitans sp. TG2]
MYYHIVPRLINALKNRCKLISIEVPEFSFSLPADDISTVRPFPNKNFFVGMKKGRKAKVGLLIESPVEHKSFTVISKWYVENVGTITHTITTYVSDFKYDMVSQDTMLCVGYGGGDPEIWGYRVHPDYEGAAPGVIDPTAETIRGRERDLSHDVWTPYPWGNFLNSREEAYLAVTIPSARLKNEYGISFFENMPQLESAHKI